MDESRWNRHLPIARNLTGADESKVLRKFLGERVLLTGNRHALLSWRGPLMLRTAANLISRFCPRIDVALPPETGELSMEIMALLRSIDQSRHAEFKTIKNPKYSSYAAILSIGGCDAQIDEVITIESSGWAGAVSQSGRLPHFAEGDETNPFGALVAAALGAAEVFKRLLRPKPGKAFHFGDVTFSSYDYAVNGSDSGPDLPFSIQLPSTVLAGVGAVGNAVLLTLANLPQIGGCLYVVDHGLLGDPTNLNRYLLAIESDVVRERPIPKVDLAQRLFGDSRLRIIPFQEPIREFLGRVHRGQVPRPEITISAVDNNDARIELQKLWPVLLLEGATGETTSQVSRHHFHEGLACLMCIHTDGTRSQADFSYISHAAGESGLTADRVAASLQDASAQVLDEDVQQAPPEKRSFLAQRVGHPLCSVLSEVSRLSARPSAELPTQPSVSFVSMISGVLATAELIKHVSKLSTPLETLFQLDSMFPLENAILQPVEKARSCYCNLRREEIRRYREMCRT